MHTLIQKIIKTYSLFIMSITPNNLINYILIIDISIYCPIKNFFTSGFKIPWAMKNLKEPVFFSFIKISLTMGDFLILNKLYH